MMRLMSRCV